MKSQARFTRIRRHAVAGALLCLGLGALAPAIAQDAADGVQEGWATPEQVTRGQTAYEQKCSTCHGTDIVSVFKSFPNAGQFFGFVSTTMPANAPGSLPAQQYADIIAFLGAENGMTVGTEELLPDDEVMATIRPAEFGDAEQ